MTAAAVSFAVARRRLGGLAFGFALACAAPAAGPAAAAVPPEAARAFVDDLATEAVGVIRATPVGSEERTRRLSALLRSRFDLPYLAQLAVGRPWRELDAGERQRFVDVFGDWVVRSQSARLGQYGGERVEVQGAQPAGDEDALVQTQIAGGGLAAPVPVVWRVRGGGALRVIDVVIGGVSMVVTYRNEFQPILQRGGVDGLVAELEARAARGQG